MKEPILTVRQPWASAIFDAGKTVENRTWWTEYRGRLWIHAGRPDTTWLEDPRLRFLLGGLPSRVVLGSVELVDIRRDSRSRWAEPDSFHWVLRDPRPLATPTPRRGYPGLTWLDPSQFD